VAGSREIERTAAAWLARRDAGHWSAADQQALDAWLDAATAHRIAFLRLEAAWQQSDRLKALGAGIPAGTMPPRHRWRHTVETPAEPRRAGSQATPRPAHHRFRHLAGWTMAATGLLIAIAGWHWHAHEVVETISYQTPVGRLQEVPLADGSVATLSSNSRIVVSLSRGERHVELQRGEAFFAVAKDAGRPFVVDTRGRRVIAVGTRFAVRRDDDATRVVVTEGLVRLESDSPPGGHRQPTTLLPAGSRALATDTGVTVTAGSVQQAEAFLDWRNGFVSFHDTPLAEAVAEFNRYNNRQIVLGDNRVGSLRVGGNFHWSNTAAFVRLLEQGFPVTASEQGNRIVLRHR